MANGMSSGFGMPFVKLDQWGDVDKLVFWLWHGWKVRYRARGTGWFYIADQSGFYSLFERGRQLAKPDWSWLVEPLM